MELGDGTIERLFTAIMLHCCGVRVNNNNHLVLGTKLCAISLLFSTMSTYKST